MKAAWLSASVIRTAIVTALIVVGLWIAWIVLIGPAILILLSPR